MEVTGRWDGAATARGELDQSHIRQLELRGSEAVTLMLLALVTSRNVTPINPADQFLPDRWTLTTFSLTRRINTTAD